MFNKIKYLYYSRRYRKILSIETIKDIKNTHIYLLGRANGKTILSIKYLYIKLVESHRFKEASQLLKEYKKIYKLKLFKEYETIHIFKK